MDLARTSASNRLIVSSGPKLLRSVINPSAAIACTPDSQLVAINTKTAILMKPIFTSP
jgi:hypothetical protein